MIVLKEDGCDGCGACVAVCPADAVELLESELRIDHEICIGCSGCMQICPWQVLEEVG